MYSFEAHLRRAERNELFARSISPVEQPEWKVIVTFYSALHYVEAGVVRAGYRSSDHASRAFHLRAIRGLRNAARAYLILSNHASEARYNPNVDLSRGVQPICDLLQSIKRSLSL